MIYFDREGFKYLMADCWDWGENPSIFVFPLALFISVLVVIPVALGHIKWRTRGSA